MKTVDLIDYVAAVASIEKKYAKAAVEAVLFGMLEAAKQGEEINLPGFREIQGQGQPSTPGA